MSNPPKSSKGFWERLLDDALSDETKKYIAEQRRAAEARPQDPRPYFHLGLLYNMQHQQDAAIQMFEQALRVDPQFALAHQHLGQIYVVQKDYRRAWAHAREAAACGNAELLEMLQRYPQLTHPAE